MRRRRSADAVLLALVLLCIPSRLDASVEAVCFPKWYTEQLQARNGTHADITCPYGRRLPGDITWRDDLPFVVNLVCVCYGYVPMLVIGIAIVEFLIVRGTRELSFVLFVGVTTLINEVVVKALISQRRPSVSCCFSCGMPSSHSSFALGFYTLMWLDAAYRVNPMDVKGEASHVCAMIREKEKGFLRGPLSHPVVLSNCAFVFTCIQWGILLLPVPMTRVILQDHTDSQVFVGSLFGILYGFAFFYGFYEPFAKYMAKRQDWRWPKDGREWPHAMQNTIKLPWWRTEPTLTDMSISDSAPESRLASDITFTPVDVFPVEEDGRARQVVYGVHLQVYGGKWSGVAWPVDKSKRRECKSRLNSSREVANGEVDSDDGSSTDQSEDVVC